MSSIFTSIFDGIREDFGIPARLLRLLERPEVRAELPPLSPCIDAGSVVPWHAFGAFSLAGHRAGIVGWRQSGSYYESFQINRDCLEIGQHEVFEDWTCDIQDVHGFSASKSDLADFTSTDEMVETNSREMISEISPERLTKNLAHSEIRIIHDPKTTDHFAHYRWDGRIFLMNSGGSHHFAAAKYIAARLGQPVPLRGKLHVHSLNPSAIAALRRSFDLFAISDEPEVVNAFHKAMQAFRATWFQHYLPRPYANASAVLLPKAEPRSMRVSEALRQAGVLDLGLHLSDLCAAQAR